MPRIYARQLAVDLRNHREAALDALQEALDLGLAGQPGGITPHDFRVRDLAEELLGYEFVKNLCDPTIDVSPWDIQEAWNAVDSTLFQAVTEQLIVREVLTAYRNPLFVLTAMIPSVDTPFSEGEIVQGLTLPRNPENDKEDALVVNEQEEYGILGFSQEYVQMPPTVKRGLVIPVSREAIFRDRTGQILRRAAYVGTILGLSKERRLTDVLIGAVNTYKEFRRGHTAVQSRNTYYGFSDQSGSPPWINHKDNNQLVDYSSLDSADNLFTDMTDPNTGEPILITGRYLIYSPPLRSTVARILNATETRHVTNTNVTTIGGNLVRPGIIPVESTWMYRRLQTVLGVSASDAAQYWFYGDPRAAFQYQQNWGIEISRQAPGADAEFWQDIVTAFKASEKGVAAILDPRYIQRHRAISTSSSGS